MEESADTIYLVLPIVSPAGEGGEISDRDLGGVAGGEENYPSPVYPSPVQIDDSNIY